MRLVFQLVLVGVAVLVLASPAVSRLCECPMNYPGPSRSGNLLPTSHDGITFSGSVISRGSGGYGGGGGYRRKRSFDGSERKNKSENGLPAASCAGFFYYGGGSGCREVSLSNDAETSVPYRNLRIAVSPNGGSQQTLNNNSITTKQMTYVPPTIFQPSSVSCSPNVETKKFEVTFSVVMWSDEMERHIRAQLESKFEAQNVMLSDIRPVAISQVQILRLPLPNVAKIGKNSRVSQTVGTNDTSATTFAPEYEVATSNAEDRKSTRNGEVVEEACDLGEEWRSYSGQKSSLDFRFVCTTVNLCQKKAEQGRVKPKQFVADLTLQMTIDDKNQKFSVNLLE